MDTRWLEDFISLAETRSFSRSANLRHVTQPAFSRRIQALESWVGQPLIDRTTFPLRLTHAGERLYSEVIPLLQHLNSIKRAIHADKVDISKRVRLAVSADVDSEYISRFLNTHNVENQFIVTTQPLKKIEEGILLGFWDWGLYLDIVGVDSVLSHAGKLKTDVLDTLDLCGFVRTSEKADSTGTSKSKRLLYTPESLISKVEPEPLDGVTIVGQVDTFANMKAMIMAGCGWGYLAKQWVVDEVLAHRICPTHLDENPTPLHVKLVMRNSAEPN